jgi:hypothetical protein
VKREHPDLPLRTLHPISLGHQAIEAVETCSAERTGVLIFIFHQSLDDMTSAKDRDSIGVTCIPLFV